MARSRERRFNVPPPRADRDTKRDGSRSSRRFVEQAASGSSDGSTSTQASTFTAVWTLVDQVNPLAIGVAFHDMAALGKDRLIVVGGFTNPLAKDFSKAMYAFDLRTNTWTEITAAPRSTKIVGLSSFALLTHVMRSSASGMTSMGSFQLIGGQREDPISGVQVSPFIYSIEIFLTTSNNNLLYNMSRGERRSVRSEAAAAGFNGVAALCGGATSYATGTWGSPDTAFQCLFVKDVTTAAMCHADNNSGGTCSAKSTFGARAVILGNMLIMFGGVSTEGTVLLSSGVGTQYAELPVCADPLLATAPMCFPCSPGYVLSRGSTCVPAPAGFYVDGSGKLQPCPAGWYSIQPGATSAAFCKICPEGTYSAQPGSTNCSKCNDGAFCEFASSSPSGSDATTRLLSTNFSTQQPSEKEDGAIPMFVYPLIGAAGAFCYAFILVVVVFNRKAVVARRNLYIDEGTRRHLREVYDRYKKHTFGLNTTQLKSALLDFTGQSFDEDFLEIIKSDHDSTGGGRANFRTLQDIVINLIADEYIMPFPLSGFARGKKLNIFYRQFADIRMKDYDSYEAEHNLGADGEPMRQTKTQLGGVFGVFSYFAMGLFIVFQLASFYYTTVNEVRGLIPELSSTATVRADYFRVRFTVVGGVGAASCINSDSTCAGILNMDGLAASGVVTCSHDAASSSCTVDWKATEFGFGTPYSPLTLNYLFSSEVYASRFEALVETSTGLPTESNTSMVIVPPRGTVFRGLPPTVIEMSALPIVLKAVDNVFKQGSVIRTGYEQTITTIVPGHSVGASQFQQSLGVSVNITFSKQDLVLVVQQLPQSSFLMFIGTLFGSVAGVCSVLAGVLQFLDGKFNDRRRAKMWKSMTENQSSKSKIIGQSASIEMLAESVSDDLSVPLNIDNEL